MASRLSLTTPNSNVMTTRALGPGLDRLVDIAEEVQQLGVE